LIVVLVVVFTIGDASGVPAPRPEVARGKFLVASEQLTDPNFRETVVLLLEYAAGGALGVVINRPTDVPLATLLPEVEELSDRADIAFIGGPVARDRMILLLRAAAAPQQSARVLEDVFITSSLDVLRDLSRAKEDVQHFRAYVGYAGWGPSQLDAEIARGDWNVAPGEPASVFAKDPRSVWPDLRERVTGQWVRAPGPWRTAAGGRGAPRSSADQRAGDAAALPPPARSAWRDPSLGLASA
jgi:putative transcriptional regulator